MDRNLLVPAAPTLRCLGGYVHFHTPLAGPWCIGGLHRKDYPLATGIVSPPVGHNLRSLFKAGVGDQVLWQVDAWRWRCVLQFRHVRVGREVNEICLYAVWRHTRFKEQRIAQQSALACLSVVGNANCCRVESAAHAPINERQSTATSWADVA